MKMSIVFKPLIIAAALAVTSAASAVTTEYSLTLNQSVPQQISVNAFPSSTGAFSDTFGFHVTTPSSFSGWVSSSVLDFGFLVINAVSFNSVSMAPGSLTSVISNTGSTHGATFSAANLAAGDYVLTLSGTTALGTPIGQYLISGSLAPVPEPESYAMFLAGLGIIGAMARRKKSN